MAPALPALEEMAASIYGAQTQKAIADANPYYRGQGVADTIGQSALGLVAQDPTRYGTKDAAIVGGLSGLISGLFGGAGNNYQQTLTDRYQNVALGREAGGDLPGTLFTGATNDRQLFRIAQAKEVADQLNKMELLKADAELRLNDKLASHALDNPETAAQDLEFLKRLGLGGSAPAVTSSTGALPPSSPVPVATAAQTPTDGIVLAEPEGLFGGESLEKRVTKRAIDIKRQLRGTTGNAALAQAKAEVAGEMRADEAGLKKLDDLSKTIREQEELYNKASLAVDKAGDTGGWLGLPGTAAIQPTLKRVTGRSNQANATKNLDSYIADFVAKNRVVGSGSTSDFESKMYIGAGASSGNEPGVNKVILENMRRQLEENKQYAQFTNAYRQEKGSLTQANDYWSTYSELVKGMPNPPSWQEFFSSGGKDLVGKINLTVGGKTDIPSKIIALKEAGVDPQTAKRLLGIR